MNQNLKTLEEERLEKEHMRDVLILLQHLVESQEATAKLIIDCLYDVGSVNLINQKFRLRLLNRMLKSIAKLSKPAFRVVALYWFKKNCPQIIANWLQSKVAFKPPKSTKKEKPQPVRKVQAVKVDNVAQIQHSNRELKRLRSQVRLLTGILIGMITVFGGSVIWIVYSFDLEPLQLIKYRQSETLLGKDVEKISNIHSRKSSRIKH